MRRRGRPRKFLIKNANVGNEPLRRPRGHPRQVQIPGRALVEIVAVEPAARRSSGQPRRVPVVAATVPVVMEPVIAALFIVAVDHAHIEPAQQPAHICDVCNVNP